MVSDGSCNSTIFNLFIYRNGVIFFVTMNQIFGTMSTLELFIRERKIFIHENSNGFYRVSVYFISKLLCDVIPMRLVPLIGFCVISYFMIGKL